MNNIEAPKLTREQEKSLSDKKRSYGHGSKPEDWEIVVADLDRDVQEIGFVVCRLDIVNALLAVASNSWDGNAVYAVAEEESASLDVIRDYYIKESVKSSYRSEDDVNGRISLDDVKKSVEFMRLSGLLNKLPDGQYKLSNATLRYWDMFAQAHDVWKKERPPTPVLRQISQEV